MAAYRRLAAEFLNRTVVFTRVTHAPPAGFAGTSLLFCGDGALTPAEENL
jgi:hypothetical protein